jgi:hypothetical protein
MGGSAVIQALGNTREAIWLIVREPPGPARCPPGGADRRLCPAASIRDARLGHHRGQEARLRGRLPRDAVHIPVIERRGIRSILSFDDDADRWPGLQRIHRV